MKRLLVIVITAVMIFGAILPAAAAIPMSPVKTEYGYSYTVSSGKLSLIRYSPMEGSDTIYVPTALDGIAVTPDELSADLYSYCYDQSAFTVDEENNYFCAVDGVLFTKDGKRLIAYPIGRDNENYIVPDTVAFIGDEVAFSCSSLTVESPDCVIEPNEAYESAVVLCGSKDSAAEKTASANGYPFILLGEGHTHNYINVIKSAPTCVTDGKIITYCPCSPNGIQTLTVPATGLHNYVYLYPLGKYVCSMCGEPKVIVPIIDDDDDVYIDEDECTCVCHADERIDTSSLSSILDCIIYRFKLLFWRLFRTHQYCECGRRHY